MLRLRVRGGDLEPGAWVYAWVANDGVIYVGATTLHPAARTWLHLHDDDPGVGRIRARFPAVADEPIEVLAHELPDGVDRQQVRHGAVAELDARGLLSTRHVCAAARATEPHAESARFVAALADELGR